jgi:hypothetical protein
MSAFRNKPDGFTFSTPRAASIVTAVARTGIADIAAAVPVQALRTSCRRLRVGPRSWSPAYTQQWTDYTRSAQWGDTPLTLRVHLGKQERIAHELHFRTPAHANAPAAVVRWHARVATVIAIHDTRHCSQDQQHTLQQKPRTRTHCST